MARFTYLVGLNHGFDDVYLGTVVAFPELTHSSSISAIKKDFMNIIEQHLKYLQEKKSELPFPDPIISCSLVRKYEFILPITIELN